jgi:glycosyltransferase involved in cell wall biosynthesis
VSNTDPIVSIIIPTKNSIRFLQNLLDSIGRQTFRSIETIVVDGHSSDGTVELAERHGAKVLTYDSGVMRGKFDAPHRRNYGVRMSAGMYVYYVDADMELHPDTIEEAVELCAAGAAAVIVAEQSFGSGPWARAKALERRAYVGDDDIEAPRFFVRSIWDELGGLDESLGGGGDDWDLHEAVKQAGYRVDRTKNAIMHNEGELRLHSLLRKRYMYGMDSWRYIKKRPRAAVHSYFPIRAAYFRNWRLFAADPVSAALVIVMRFSEYGAGFAGALIGIVSERRQSRLVKDIP